MSLLPLEAKIRDPQVRGVVAHHALHILREAVGSLGINIERQRHVGAADAIQLAQDRLGDVAHLRRRTIGIKLDLGIETARPRADVSSGRPLYLAVVDENVMEKEEAVQKLQDMPLADRRVAAVAADVSKRDKFRSIDAHELASLLGWIVPAS